MTYPGVLLDNFSTSVIKTPGYFEGGALPPAITDKRIAPNAKVYAGLFVGRAATNTDFGVIEDLSQITSPTVNDVKGVVAKIATREITQNFTFSYGNLASLFYAEGENISLITQIRSRVYVMVGENFDPTASTERGKVYIATTTTTTPGSEVWAGSVVSSTYANALDISSIASAAFKGTAANVARGDLIPLYVDQLSA